jgi:hypothetical protein
MQTGDRISYRPDTAAIELQRLPQLLRSSETALVAIAETENAAPATHAQVPGQPTNTPAPPADPSALDLARARAERLSRATSALREALQN